MFSQFFENQSNEICSHLSEKESKGTFLKPENGSKITVTKEKERRKRKSEENKRRRTKKAMAALFVFIIATCFGNGFWPEKTVGRKRSGISQ